MSVRLYILKHDRSMYSLKAMTRKGESVWFPFLRMVEGFEDAMLFLGLVVSLLGYEKVEGEPMTTWEVRMNPAQEFAVEMVVELLTTNLLPTDSGNTDRDFRSALENLRRWDMSTQAIMKIMWGAE